MIAELINLNTYSYKDWGGFSGDVWGQFKWHEGNIISLMCKAKLTYTLIWIIAKNLKTKFKI